MNRAKTGFGGIEGDRSYQSCSIFLPSLRAIRGVGEGAWSKLDGGDVPVEWLSVARCHATGQSGRRAAASSKSRALCYCKSALSARLCMLPCLRRISAQCRKLWQVRHAAVAVFGGNSITHLISSMSSMSSMSSVPPMPIIPPPMPMLPPLIPTIPLPMRSLSSMSQVTHRVIELGNNPVSSVTRYV